MVGTVMDPHPAYALGRGLKTLPLRVAQHNANALAVATFLSTDRRVSRVYYPGLPSHPDHEIARRQMTRLRRDGLHSISTAATSAPRASTTGCRSSSARPASAASRA